MNMMKRATQERSAFTYILKETLDFIAKSWGTEDFSRVAERNLKAYKAICTEYRYAIIKFNLSVVKTLENC